MAPVAPVAGKSVSGIGPAGPTPGTTAGKHKFSEVFSSTGIQAPAAAARPDGTQGLGSEVLGRIQAGRRRLDQILQQARAGRSFRPRELLAMQAEIYQIGEELALVNKVVEQGVAGVKRVWNLQV